MQARKSITKRPEIEVEINSSPNTPKTLIEYCMFFDSIIFGFFIFQ